MSEEKKYLIDRTELPYDAFVADRSWLCPIAEDGESDKEKCALTNSVNRCNNPEDQPLGDEQDTGER